MSALLEFVKFTSLNNWSVAHLLESNFNYNQNYTLEKIGTFIKRDKTQVNIDDDITYTRVTIRSKNNGVCIRDTEIGKNIGTKKQFIIKEGQFLLSKIDARNGAFGIATAELEGAIITADFFAYGIDTNKINPYFLSLITTTKQFIQFAQNSSTGTTNRQRINEKLFLDVTIPLPSLEIQNKIVKKYQDKLNLSVLQEQQAKDKEKEIEEYLYKELGIERPKKKEKTNSLLGFVNFKDVSIWSYEQVNSNNSFSCDSDMKCDISSLENMCIFKKKPFRKKEHKQSTFNVPTKSDTL